MFEINFSVIVNYVNTAVWAVVFTVGACRPGEFRHRKLSDKCAVVLCALMMAMNFAHTP